MGVTTRLDLIKMISAAAVLLLFSALQVRAQEPIQSIPDAELVFVQAVEAFEEGDYGMAFRRFRMVYSTYPLNRKTTAAMLMAGKALYRDGQYEDAIEILDTLVSRYPTSGYLDEARRVIGFAQQLQNAEQSSGGVLNLGIVLPLQGEDARLAQALFTGVRIAVEEHNALNDQPIKMLFRDSQGESQRAAEAVSELADLGVGVIVGPLYSDEAQAAAQAAERARVVLIPPLANDEAVSDGRDYVFQANPTISTHGRLMARFAIQSMIMNEFGIVAGRDRDAISERMAEGFQEEALLQGTDVRFYELLESPDDWAQLGEAIGDDTLQSVDAIYFPMAGGDVVTRIDAVFSSLYQAGAERVRVLGNTEWHGLPNPNQASRYGATYTNDFYVDGSDASVQSFSDRFNEVTGRTPDPSSTIGRLGFTAYDVTRFVLTHLTSSSSRPMHERLRRAPAYQGLGIRIDFRNGNVNEALYYLRYQDGRSVLVR